MSGTLHTAFVDELRDAYDAEKQLIKAIPTLAKSATSDRLRHALESHLEQTKRHAERLERVFASVDEKPRGTHCAGMAGIIDEGNSILEEELEESAMDACIIAAGQRVEHYEMAAYGTLIAWAQAMGHEEAVVLLRETLEEEKAADHTLSGLAVGGINQDAAGSAHPAGTAPSRAGRK
jgi:ferritin-like metal-binding protein YciE